MSRICEECGARVADDATVCDLCGSPVEASTTGHEVGASASEKASPAAGGSKKPKAASPAPTPAPKAGGDGVFCNACGWKNPPGARFCSQCGSQLQDVAGAVSAAPARKTKTKPVRPEDVAHTAEAGQHEGAASKSEQKVTSRQVGIVVGAAVLLVVALFLITVLSEQRQNPPKEVIAPAVGETSSSSSTPSASTGDVLQDHAAIPLSPDQEKQVSALEDEIEGLEGDAKREKQRALVNLLVGFGRVDRAATLQREIAQNSGSTGDWQTAGDLLFEWMEGIQGDHKTEVAQYTVEAYKKVLEENPDDLDVRANMAWAYQYDPQNSMQAITENNQILEIDPNHLQANYNRGIFLMRINRLDQAVEQMKKVKTIAGQDSPYFRQADAVIQAIQDAKSGQSG